MYSDERALAAHQIGELLNALQDQRCIEDGGGGRRWQRFVDVHSREVDDAEHAGRKAEQKQELIIEWKGEDDREQPLGCWQETQKLPAQK